MKAIKDVRLSFNEVVLYLGGDRVLTELIYRRLQRPWAARKACPALDLLRRCAIRAAEPIEAAHQVADPESPDGRG